MKEILKEAFEHEAQIKEVNFTNEIDNKVWNGVCESVYAKNNFFFKLLVSKGLKGSMVTAVIFFSVVPILLYLLFKPNVTHYPKISLYVTWNDSIYINTKDLVNRNKIINEIGKDLRTEAKIFEIEGEPTSQKVAVLVGKDYEIYRYVEYTETDALNSVFVDMASETKLPFSNKVGKVTTTIKGSNVEIPIELETKIEKVSNMLYNVKFIASWKDINNTTLTHSWEYQTNIQITKMINEDGSPLPEFD